MTAHDSAKESSLPNCLVSFSVPLLLLACDATSVYQWNLCFYKEKQIKLFLIQVLDVVTTRIKSRALTEIGSTPNPNHIIRPKYIDPDAITW